MSTFAVWVNCAIYLSMISAMATFTVWRDWLLMVNISFIETQGVSNICLNLNIHFNF